MQYLNWKHRKLIFLQWKMITYSQFHIARLIFLNFAFIINSHQKASLITMGVLSLLWAEQALRKIVPGWKCSPVAEHGLKHVQGSWFNPHPWKTHSWENWKEEEEEEKEEEGRGRKGKRMTNRKKPSSWQVDVDKQIGGRGAAVIHTALGEGWRQEGCK